jgi:hypothetical protein
MFNIHGQIINKLIALIEEDRRWLTLEALCKPKDYFEFVGLMIPQPQTNAQILKALHALLKEMVVQPKYLNWACMKYVVQWLESFYAMEQECHKARPRELEDDSDIYLRLLQAMTTELETLSVQYRLDKSIPTINRLIAELKGITDTQALQPQLLTLFKDLEAAHDNETINLSLDKHMELMQEIRFAAARDFAAFRGDGRSYVGTASLLTMPEVFSLDSPSGKLERIKIPQPKKPLFSKQKEPSTCLQLAEDKVNKNVMLLAVIEEFLKKQLVEPGKVAWLRGGASKSKLQTIVYMLFSRWNPCLRYYFLIRSVLFKEGVSVENIEPEVDSNIFTFSLEQHEQALLISMKVRVLSGSTNGIPFAVKPGEPCPIVISLTCRVLIETEAHACDVTFTEATVTVRREGMLLRRALPEVFGDNEAFIKRAIALSRYYKATGLYVGRHFSTENKFALPNMWRYYNSLALSSGLIAATLALIPRRLCADSLYKTLNDETGEQVSIAGYLWSKCFALGTSDDEKKFSQALVNSGWPQQTVDKMMPAFALLLSPKGFTPMERLIADFLMDQAEKRPVTRYKFTQTMGKFENGARYNLTYDKRTNCCKIHTKLGVSQLSYTESSTKDVQVFSVAEPSADCFIVFESYCLVPMEPGAPIKFGPLQCHYFPIMFTVNSDPFVSMPEVEFCRRRLIAEQLGQELREFLRAERCEEDRYNDRYLSDVVNDVEWMFFENCFRMQRRHSLLESYNKMAYTATAFKDEDSKAGVYIVGSKNYCPFTAINGFAVPELPHGDVNYWAKVQEMMLAVNPDIDCESYRRSLNFLCTDPWLSPADDILKKMSNIIALICLAGDAPLLSLAGELSVFNRLGGETIKVRRNIIIASEATDSLVIHERVGCSRITSPIDREEIVFDEPFLLIDTKIIVHSAPDKAIEFKSAQLMFNWNFYKQRACIIGDADESIPKVFNEEELKHWKSFSTKLKKQVEDVWSGKADR